MKWSISQERVIVESMEPKWNKHWLMQNEVAVSMDTSALLKRLSAEEYSIEKIKTNLKTSQILLPLSKIKKIYH